jgi:hypothetical protein
VGQGRGSDAALITPGATVENSGDGSEQDVAPVEERGALVPVGKAEEHGGEEQGHGTAEAPFEQILQPAAKEELLWYGDAQKGEEECAEGRERSRPHGMKVEKSQDPAEEDGNGGVETELAQRNAGIAQGEAKIESNAIELAHNQEAEDACVQQ